MINNLSSASSLSSGDQFKIYQPNQGDERRISAGALLDFVRDNVFPPPPEREVIQSVETVEALSQLQGQDNEIVYVRQFASDRPYGGGWFEWKSGSLSAVSGVVIPVPPSGYWHRIIEGGRLTAAQVGAWILWYNGIPGNFRDPALLTTTQKIANATILNNAMTWCGQNRVTFDLEAGTYQIQGAVFRIPDVDGVKVRGFSDIVTNIVRFDVGTVIQAGRVAGSDGQRGLDVLGLAGFFGEGVNTTGQTSAVAFQIGSCWQSKFEKIRGGGRMLGATPPDLLPWIALWIAAPNVSSRFFFQNKVQSINFRGAQFSINSTRLTGTPNFLEDLYFSQGGAPHAHTMPAAGAIAFDFPDFDAKTGWRYVMNLEWVKAPQIMRIRVCRQFIFDQLHLEGVGAANDSNAILIHLDGSQVAINSLSVQEPYFRAADLPSGSNQPSVFVLFSSELFVRGIKFQVSDFSGTGKIDRDFFFVKNNNFNRTSTNMQSGNPSLAVIEAAQIIDTENEIRDYIVWGISHTASVLSEIMPRRWNKLVEDSCDMYIEGAQLDISEDYTLYSGFFPHASVIASNSLAADVTLTLSNKAYPSGILGHNMALRDTLYPTVLVNRRNGAKTNDFFVHNHLGQSIATVEPTNRFRFGLNAQGTRFIPIDGSSSVEELFYVRAWADTRLTDTPPTVHRSENIASVTRIETGRFQVTFTNNAPDSRYAVTVSANPNTAQQGVAVYEKLNTGFRIEFREGGASTALYDPDNASFMVVW